MCLLSAALSFASDARERVLFDKGWKFKKDDAPGITLESSTLSRWLLPTSDSFLKRPKARPSYPDQTIGASISHLA